MPADLSGWFERAVGIVRRSFGPLLVLQIPLTIISAVFAYVVNAAVSDLNRSVATNPRAVDLGAVGTLLGIEFVGLAVLLVVGAFTTGATVFLAIKHAYGDPVTPATALRFAAGRALALIGWSLLVGLLIGVGTLLLIVPGIYLAIVFVASVSGVVVVERGGIGRCFALVNARFWPTAGRVLVLVGISVIYYVLVGLLASAFGAGSVTATIVQAVLGLPLGVFTVAATVVTYAELRFRERPGVLTWTLAAELDR